MLWTGKTVYTKKKETDEQPQIRPASGILYDMTGFIGQCVDLCLELSGMQCDKLNKKANVPWLPDSSTKPGEFEPRGQLAAVASEILMKNLYAARMVRYDLFVYSDPPSA